MRTILFREIRLNLKNLLIWGFAVGGLGLVCILLYESMQGDMKEMADAFSNMGAFSDAFGMSTLSIATLKGYFATEVGVVHGLGGAMFAAITAIGIVSKEEELHTGEFLLSFPISRNKAIAAKGLCVAVLLLVFMVICGACYLLGFAVLGEEIPAAQFFTFMGRNLLMNVEVSAVCFFISSWSGKNRMGLGIGLALMCYFYDLMGRVVPDLKEWLFIGPYSYVNASEIFTDADTPVKAIVVAVIIAAAFIAGAFVRYNGRDLAS